MQSTSAMLHLVFKECYNYYFWTLQKICKNSILEWQEPTLVDLNLSDNNNFKFFQLDDKTGEYKFNFS